MFRKYSIRLAAMSWLAVAALASTTTVASPAVAADADTSPAADDIALTNGQVLALQKRMKDTTDWAKDEDKREGGKVSIQGVESGIARIKKADPKWDVSAWEKLVAQARARLKKAEDAVAAQEAAAEANEKSYREYIALLSKVREGYDLLVELEKNPGKMKIYSANQVVENLAKAIAKVGSLDAACKERQYGKLSVPGSYKLDPAAAVACKLAAKRGALGQKYLDHQLQGGVKREAEYLQGVIDDVRQGKKVEANDHNGLMDASKRIASFRKPYDSAAEMLGAKLNEKAFAPIEKVVAGYAAAVEEAAKTSRFDPKAKIADAGATTAVTKQHKKGGLLPEGRVIKVRAAYGWSTKKNLVGRPISREHDVNVLVQIKGESFCRLYFRNAYQAYKGYWRPVVVGGGESTFRISACK